MLRFPERFVRQASYAAATVVGRYPWLALPVARWRGHGVPVGPETDIVIEGYPRSGNHFTVAAFQLAQSRVVRVAHHTHVPANIIAAVRNRIPVLVLVRNPEDAVVDFVSIKPFLTAGLALRGYVRFYERLLPYRDRFVVGSFEDVNTDLGAVIRRVNGRFATDFVEFTPTKESVQAVQEAAARLAAQSKGPGLPLIGRTSPSPGAGEDLRNAVRLVYRSPVLATARKRARRIHDILVGVAVNSTDAGG
jgi:hypothetical protein